MKNKRSKAVEVIEPQSPPPPPHVRAIPDEDRSASRTVLGSWTEPVEVNPALSNAISYLIDDLNTYWDEISIDAAGPHPRDVATAQLRAKVVCDVMSVLIGEWQARGVAV